MAELKNYNKLPKYEGFNGTLAGSQQPGYKKKSPAKELKILANL